MAGPKPEDFDKAFGIAVARARDECDPWLSQETLANKAAISRKALYQIERGERPARLSEAAAIADALAVPLESLLGLGLDGKSEKELRRMLTKLERDHLALTERIAEAEEGIAKAEEGIALIERQINAYRGTRALIHNDWIKVRMAMEKRGFDVEHQ